MRTGDGGAPVAGAEVVVDGREVAVTDSVGVYRCAGVAGGYRALRFVAHGYQPRAITVFLADSADLELDVELTPVPVILPNLEALARPAPSWVIPSPVSHDSAPEAGRYIFSSGWQTQLVARDVDAQEALTTLPGVATRGDGAAGISIRGGTATENLVLLDGIPMFNASHFTSAASAIDPDALSGLDVHTGVSSARFGGRLSGVVELETAELGGDSVRVTGGFGPTDVRSMVRGPLGSAGGFLVGGRLTFRNLSDDDDGDASPVASKYRDFIGIARVALGAGTLRLISFHGTNQFALEQDGSPDPGNGGLNGFATPANDIQWQSSSVGAIWVRGAAGAPRLRVSAWWAGTSGAIDWLSAGGTEQLHSRLSELGLAADLVRPLAAGALGLGASIVRPRTTYSAAALGVGSDTISTVALSAAPAIASLFAEWSSKPATFLGVRAGLRANSDFHHATNLEPRISLGIRAGPATRVDVGLGRTHQTVQSLFNDENVLGTLLGLELPVAAGGAVPTASADQLGLGVSQRIGSGLSVALDGYLRRWAGVIVPAATTLTAFATDSVVAGRGNAAGLVASAAFDRGAASVHVSAGVARSVQWAGANEYHAGFEQPWSVSATAGYRFARRTLAQLALTAGAGEATSVLAGGLEWRPAPPAGGGEIGGAPMNLPGPINAARLPGFVRLDLGVRRWWPLAGFGPRGSLLTTLRLVNLLNRANAVGLTAGPDGIVRSLRGTPRGVTFEVGWTF